MFFCAKLWNLKEVTDDFRTSTALFVDLFNAGVHALLTASNLLACIGWGTIYEEMPKSSASVLSLALWAGVVASEHVNSWFAVVVSYCCVASLVRICKALFDAKIYHIFSDYQVIYDKFYQIHQFCLVSLCFGFVYIVVALFIAFSCNMKSGNVVLLELGIFGVAVLDMIFWLLRKKFVPEGIASALELEDTLNVVAIDDPNGEHVAIAT